MLKDFVDEYKRYQIIGQKTLAQISDEYLNKVLGADNNSIAVIVRHISGNLISRFTDFLSSDGEKSWRDRDSEFVERDYGREELNEIWDKGWQVLEMTLGELTDEDLPKTVTIRGHKHSVHEALSRSIAHIAYHVGQIVLLARIFNDGNWQWISVPKGKSKEYNQNPTMEKRPT
jgi:uncharacterized damage-inducible protein DinB